MPFIEIHEPYYNAGKNAQQRIASYFNETESTDPELIVQNSDFQGLINTLIELHNTLRPELKYTDLKRSQEEFLVDLLLLETQRYNLYQSNEDLNTKDIFIVENAITDLYHSNPDHPGLLSAMISYSKTLGEGEDPYSQEELLAELNDHIDISPLEAVYLSYVLSN